jgi:phosphomannomutase
MDYDEAVRKELIHRFDPSWTYYQHLTELVNVDIISNGELNIVADSMWGAGRGAFASILSRTRCRVTEIRNLLNPGFGGIHPEPILRYLIELVAAVQRGQADVGLATDGDADRIGAIDAHGNFIDPHHVFALTLRILMGLILLEIMAHEGAPLHEIVADLQATFGPAHYGRIDAHLVRQVPKKQMVQMLVDTAPNQIGGETVARVDTLDGVKFYLADGSWLLIRPSGTEPVLRIYAEAHAQDAVKAMLHSGSEMGNQVLASTS